MLKHHTKFSVLMTLGLGAALAAACDGDRKKNAVKEPPQRSGSLLESVTTRYQDGRPSLSEAGTRLVYVSGRDSAERSPSLKAYKVEWPAGSPPGAVARVTSVELGVEKDALLSPDGAWVVLTVAQGGRSDLYLQDFGGARPAVRLTDDAATETQVAFSPDSTALSWVTYDGARAKVRLVELGDGSAAALATKAQVGADTEEQTAAFWIPTADATYKLAVASPVAQGKSATRWRLYAFAKVASAAAAAPADWLTGVLLAPGVLAEGASSRALFVRRVLSSSSKAVERVGDAEVAKDATRAKVPVTSEPLVIETATSGELALKGESIGYEVLAANLAKDGGAAFFVSRHLYQCQGDERESYGTALVVAPLDGTALSRLSPRLASVTKAEKEGGQDTLVFEAAQGYCDRTKSGSATKLRIDDRIVSASFNRLATVSKFRAAYVSRFSHRFDDACQLKTGDPEVLLMDVDGASRRIYEVAPNRAPITDADRGGSGACVL